MAKGPFYGMSDYDINRLIDTFLVYASNTKRFHCIQLIEAPSSDGNDIGKFELYKSLCTPVKAALSPRSSVPGQDIDPEKLRIKHQILEETR